MFRRADRVLDAKASVIDWAPWAEIGMAVRGSVQQTLEAAGIDFVLPKAGAEFLARELARTAGGAEVLAAGKTGHLHPMRFPFQLRPANREALRRAKGTGSLALTGEYVKACVSLDPTHPTLDHHRIDRAAVFRRRRIGHHADSGFSLESEAGGASFENVRFKSPLKTIQERLV